MEKIYKKKFKSDPDNLVEVENFIIEVTGEHDFDEEIINNLTLSLSEAASNAMVHGNKLDPKKYVDVTITINENKIEVVIKDEGNGFDPNAVPDPTSPENLLKDSGRGIHIMKTFLENLQYNFTEDGTEVTLIISLK